MQIFTTPMRDLFKRHGLTQVEVASALGITQGYVSQVLSGDVLPSLLMALRFVEYLRAKTSEPVTVEQLFGDGSAPISAATTATSPADAGEWE